MTITPNSSDIHEQVEQALNLFGIPNSAIGPRALGRKRGVEVVLTGDEIEALSSQDNRDLSTLGAILREVAEENHLSYEVRGLKQGAYIIYLTESRRKD